jgi:hypothetical protein
LTAPREEDGIRSEMESGKKSFSCRGERDTLDTDFISLPVREEITDEWRVHDGGRRRRPMMLILGAKQPQGLED